MTSDLTTFFEERLAEIEAYVTFLTEIEKSAQEGPPRLVGSDKPISPSQIKMLYSSVYLQVYNLVEATISRCIDAVTAAAAAGGQWKPGDLNLSLRNEWIRAVARTHTDMSPDLRLENAVRMFDHLVGQLPLEGFTVEVGGGGNWDDDSIEKVSGRLGCSLTLTTEAKTAAKRHVRDELGAMKLVKNRRNRLAHGAISFVDCADGVSVDELRLVVEGVGLYLREATACFVKYIETAGYVRSSRAEAAR